MNELLKMLTDKQFYKDVGGRLLDAANRGGVAGTLGAPVDIATMAMRPFGYNVEKPVMGSEWLGQKMQDSGMVSPERNAIAEMLSSFVVPSGMAKAGAGMFNAEQNALRNLAAPATMNKEAGAIVWHGSPHKFDKFDSSKIGTGEGAQAYGHGLYLAESPDVAKGYKEALTNWQLHKPDGGLFDASVELKNPNVKAILQKTNGDIDAAIARANQSIESIPNTMGADYAAQDIKTLQAIKDAGGLNRPEGSLYKVDLPDEHIAKMLDWDKPLSQQHPDVQKALGKLDPESWHPSGADYDANQRGQWTYMQLAAGNKNKAMTQALATKELQQAGIPGIRYLDGGSRGAGQGSSNFVVFPGNENMLQILERNGKATP